MSAVKVDHSTLKVVSCTEKIKKKLWFRLNAIDEHALEPDFEQIHNKNKSAGEYKIWER